MSQPVGVQSGSNTASRGIATSCNSSERSERSRPLFEEQPYMLAAQLEQALGREVDLVELNRAPPDLLHEVLRDGKLRLDREAAYRVRAEVRGRAEYLDMLPVLRRHRRRTAP